MMNWLLLFVPIAIALILPATYNNLVGSQSEQGLWFLSISISIVLLVVYVLFLVFSLGAHKVLFTGSIQGTEEENRAAWPVGKALLILAVATAAEHATAISAAMKNRMDLSLSIAIGSSVQVALFVAPVLVLASLWTGPAPMDLLFGTGLVVAILLSVLITAQVAGDGRSDW